MTADIVPFTSSTTMDARRPGPEAPGIDSWIPILADVAKLAQQIADTDFVPAAMRGKPAAVAAAILAGREMGVGPMTALANINVIKGKPGSNALLMRQLALFAGHAIRYIETTDTLCVVEGRRRGEDTWTRVTFTADQARKAGIQLGGYPEDKLVARATTRLCRRKFADAIGGMPYSTEELEDGDDVTGMDAEVDAAATSAPPAPAGRTAKRRTATRARPQPAPEPDPEPDEAPAAGPPLPGEPDEPSSDEPVPLSKAQLTKLQTIFTNHDVTDRDERLGMSSTLIGGRDLTSANDLTLAEAGVLIDALERLAAAGPTLRDAYNTLVAQMRNAAEIDIEGAAIDQAAEDARLDNQVFGAAP